MNVLNELNGTEYKKYAKLTFILRAQSLFNSH